MGQATNVETGNGTGVTAKLKLRAPEYDVYEELTLDRDGEPVTALVLVAGAVKATIARAAIVQATSDRRPEDQGGTFRVGLTGALRKHVRQITVQPVDDWK